MLTRDTVVFAVLFLCLAWLPGLEYGVFAEEKDMGNDDTMLMFVGENIEALSIASRREESANQAPAVARVVSRREFREKGIQSVSQALVTIPGFYLADKEWGTQPYLRGIPNSILFLFDTVPITSDVTKTRHPIDAEMSLASVKRIEIIRGAGSVLWGPDAFAGIVNIVPLTGKDFEGMEGGVSYEVSDRKNGFFFNYGVNRNLWDGFFSVSGRKGEEDDTNCNVARFWGDGKKPVPADLRLGSTTPGDSEYLEATGRVAWGGWLTGTMRFSDFTRSYAMTDSYGEYTWPEKRSASFSLFKIEGKRSLSRNQGLRFTGSFTQLNPRQDVIDLSIKEREKNAYGELIYDWSFRAGQSLLTSGVSYRKKKVKDAPVWESYFPDYLSPDNQNVLPEVTRKDYDSGLWSVFAQYNHKIEDTDLWIGVRHDNHDAYKDHFSVTGGLRMVPARNWSVKALYGTAYRTPFASQLLEAEKPDLEKIESVNLQTVWQPSKRMQAGICLFYSKISNHIMEDPYAGLSLPNEQELTGVEMDTSVQVTESLRMKAALTLIHPDEENETYRYNYYTYIRPDGTIEKQYRYYSYPYDAAAETIGHLKLLWTPKKKFSFYAGAHYYAERQLVFPRTESVSSAPQDWSFDVNLAFHDFFTESTDISVTLEHMGNTDDILPGTYNFIDAPSNSVTLQMDYKW